MEDIFYVVLPVIKNSQFVLKAKRRGKKIWEEQEEVEAVARLAEEEVAAPVEGRLLEVEVEVPPLEEEAVRHHFLTATQVKVLLRLGKLLTFIARAEHIIGTKNL